MLVLGSVILKTVDLNYHKLFIFWLGSSIPQQKYQQVTLNSSTLSAW